MLRNSKMGVSVFGVTRELKICCGQQLEPPFSLYLFTLWQIDSSDPEKNSQPSSGVVRSLFIL